MGHYCNKCGSIMPVVYPCERQVYILACDNKKCKNYGMNVARWLDK
jgi:hypothetical protein